MFQFTRNLFEDQDHPVGRQVCTRTGLARRIVLDILSRFDVDRSEEVVDLSENSVEGSFDVDPIELQPEFHQALEDASDAAKAELRKPRFVGLLSRVLESQATYPQ